MEPRDTSLASEASPEMKRKRGAWDCTAVVVDGEENGVSMVVGLVGNGERKRIWIESGGSAV